MGRGGEGRKGVGRCVGGVQCVHIAGGGGGEAEREETIVGRSGRDVSTGTGWIRESMGS